MTVPNVTDAPAAPSQVLRVAIVDDDPFVLQALRAYLSSDERIEVTSTFSRAADALAFLHKIRVDVLLTDVRMPEMDGLELLTRVRRQWPRTAVVVLTSFDDDEAMVAALAQHANGFLLKDASPEEIIRAVIAASAGGTTISPAATSRLVTRHLRSPQTAQAPDVTEAEQAVLTLLCEGYSNAGFWAPPWSSPCPAWPTPRTSRSWSAFGRSGFYAPPAALARRSGTSS